MATVSEILVLAAALNRAELGELRSALQRLEQEADSFYLLALGVRYRFLPLSDRDYQQLRRRSLCIDDDDFYLYRFLEYCLRPEQRLSRGELTAVLLQLFGESSACFDDWKQSFSYPFALTLHKGNQTLDYLFVIRDYRGSLEIGIRKVVAERDPRLEDGYIHKPFASEFSREEINELIRLFYLFLSSSWSVFRPAWREPFYRVVQSNHIVYGFAEGRFFDEEISHEGQFEKACGRCREIIERERLEWLASQAATPTP